MQASTRHVGRCFFCSLRLRPLTTSRSFSATCASHRSSSPAKSSNKLGSLGARFKPKRDGGLVRRQRFAPKLTFHDALQERLAILKDELHEAPIGQKLDKDGSFRNVWKTFVKLVAGPSPDLGTTIDQFTDRKKEHQALREAFYERGINSLDDRIKYAFYDYVTTARFTHSDIRNQKTLADLRYPTEWFPSTRSLHRTIHLHVGPTNSGKTYHALKRLEQAESGFYAGPLRLLAHEVYTRLNAKGKRCILVTGEERRVPDDCLTSEMSSCTVEMIPLNRPCEVAVIDEIQMIGNAERGWAWTQALLGVQAREVHLCGEARTVPLIRELCASVGEKIIVHEYQRLSPLQMADSALDGDLKKLRKGDCIVSFSVMGIHALRTEIEKTTGKKVATVYGSLPPETRAQQARLFNDPDNDYDFLVASDAIGMGLNLSIKRVIFETSSKYDGYRQRTLAVPDIKQIAGRAGRYRSAFQDNKQSESSGNLAEVKGDPEPGAEVTGQSAATDAQATMTMETAPPAEQDSKNTDNVPAPTKKSESESSTLGLVTTLEKIDLPIITAAMKTEPEPLRTAGIFPPAAIVERFASYFPPGTPFSYILMRLHELAQMHSRFHLCGLRDQLWIADLIEPIQGLTTTDRNILCAAPASKSDSDLYKRLLPALARCIEQQSGGSLVDIQEIPLEVLELELSPKRDYLRQLERLHKSIVTYLWLSYRFAGIFTTRPLAFHVKGMVEEKIEEVLHQFSFTENQRQKIKAAREKSMIEEFRREMMSKSDDGSGPESQTTYSAGGDHFSGETDLDVMDAAERLAASDDTATIAEKLTGTDSGKDLPARGSAENFAEWRTSQTIRDDSGSDRPQPRGSEELESAFLDEVNLAHESPLPSDPEAEDLLDKKSTEGRQPERAI